MLLAVDIGNTNITVAVMKGEKVLHKFFLPSMMKAKNEINAAFDLLPQKYDSIRNAFICSVVPALTPVVTQNIYHAFKITPLIIGKDVIVPIENNYRKPEEVGQDRLVCSYAGKVLYGYPSIIIDLGTAITFDVVSESGSYEGGLIIPGIRLSMESLSHKTALLPHIDDVKSPKNLIGKSTQESILSGIFNGYGAMCSGLIDKLSAEFTQEPKVIVTGGHTRLMKKFIEHKIHAVETSLVFKGIYLISRQI